MKLIDCVEQVESGVNPLAVRFEPALFDGKPNWITEAAAKWTPPWARSADTGLMVMCTSWGAYQMLGANIVQSRPDFEPMNYGFLEQETDAEDFIRSLGFEPGASVASMTDANLLLFASKWNGPGNPEAYVRRMKSMSA